VIAGLSNCVAHCVENPKRRVTVTVRSILLLGTTVITIIAVAACNGDDGGNGNGDGNGGTFFDVEMGEFFFEPNELEGAAGEEITIELTNDGTQVHTFTIQEGAPRGENFDDWGADDVDIEVPTGESGSITLTLPDEAGEYEFICRIPGHYEAGQWGTLTVN
jgi:plastocyanin